MFHLKEGVSIVDHLTAAKQFELFERNEAQQGRQVTGKWSCSTAIISNIDVKLSSRTIDRPKDP